MKVWLLFYSGINNMAFVLFQLTTWLSKLTTAGKARRGCMNLHSNARVTSVKPQKEQWLSEWRKDGQDKAMIGLKSDKNSAQLSFWCVFPNMLVYLQLGTREDTIWTPPPHTHTHTQLPNLLSVRLQFHDIDQSALAQHPPPPLHKVLHVLGNCSG